MSNDWVVNLIKKTACGVQAFPARALTLGGRRVLARFPAN
jgi:hypothetical protein